MAANGSAPPVGQENVNTDIITLTRFLTEGQAKQPEATGDFTYVVNLTLAFALLLIRFPLSHPGQY